MNSWKDWSIKKIFKEDTEFPKNLKRIKNCPKSLFYRGVWGDDLFNKCISIVGSRRMTRYASEVVDYIIPTLVENKITIISGFMYGIDSEVHRSCVNLKGRTIAVLGSGLNYLYPLENDDLYTNILNNNGLVISEYETDFKPTIWSYPQRNRIVAGLSTLGILVIEASMKSGSLITTKFGKEYGKNIFAVPGPINSKNSEGTNWLIKNSEAKIVTNINDILSNVITKKRQTKLFEFELNEIEYRVLKMLENDKWTSDEISKKINRNIMEISVTLSKLTLKDLILEENGFYYRNTIYDIPDR